MTDRVRLDWAVPSGPWQRFREYVRDEFGSLDGYLGHEAERAMREYLDADDYAGLEEQVDRLVRAAGRTPSGAADEKKSISGEETNRVTVWIHEQVKHEFGKLASESDNPHGVVLARALEAYRNGGRAERLMDKLGRVVDDAEMVLAELNDETDEGLSEVESKTIAICNRLGESFKDEELNEHIRDVAGESAPTIRDYRERLVERLDLVRHPNCPELWIGESKATDIAPDVPTECIQEPGFMTADERARRLRFAAGQRAATRGNGGTRVSVDQIRADVFDEQVTKADATRALEDAADAPGFSVDQTGDSPALVVDLQQLKYVAEEDGAPEAIDLLNTIIKYRDSDADHSLPDSAATTIKDFDSGQQTARADGGQAYGYSGGN